MRRRAFGSRTDWRVGAGAQRGRAGGRGALLVEDGVVLEEPLAGEVHLGDEPAPEGRSEQREVYVRRPPGVVVVLPRVGPRLDRDEAVAALVVGETSARAGGIRAQRGGGSGGR